MRIVVLILFLLCGVRVFAESQPPAPTPSESIEKHKSDSNQNEKNPTEVHKLGTDDAPFVVKLQTPTTDHPKAKEAEEKHKDYSSSEWWLVYLTFALVFVTFGLAIYTAKLWRSTKVLAQDAKDTADRQAADMQASLRIAKDAADAAKDQAQTATEALQRSKRAWIGVLWPVDMVTPLSFDKNEAHCNIRFTIKNVGVSPAVSTCLTCKLIVGPYPHPDPRTYVTVADKGFLEMATNSFGIPVIPGDPMQWSTIEVKEQITAAGKNDVSVWLSGYFGYKDEFGILHSSSFLFSFVNPDGERNISPSKIVEGKFEPFGTGWVST
jgi:hypothetical protein